MPHFQAYYSLFDGEAPACMPRFVDEGIWPLKPSEAAATDDVLTQADLLRERDVSRGLGGTQPHAIHVAARSIGREEQARFGRFYTCTAASTDEGWGMRDEGLSRCRCGAQGAQDEGTPAASAEVGVARWTSNCFAWACSVGQFHSASV